MTSQVAEFVKKCEAKRSEAQRLWPGIERNPAEFGRLTAKLVFFEEAGFKVVAGRYGRMNRVRCVHCGQEYPLNSDASQIRHVWREHGYMGQGQEEEACQA